MESTTSAGRLDRNEIADAMRRPVAERRSFWRRLATHLGARKSERQPGVIHRVASTSPLIAPRRLAVKQGGF